MWLQQRSLGSLRPSVQMAQVSSSRKASKRPWLDESDVESDEACIKRKQSLTRSMWPCKIFVDFTKMSNSEVGFMIYVRPKQKNCLFVLVRPTVYLGPDRIFFYFHLFLFIYFLPKIGCFCFCFCFTKNSQVFCMKKQLALWTGQYSIVNTIEP